MIKKDSLSYVYDLNYSIYDFDEFMHKYVKEKDNFAICLLDMVNFKFCNYTLGYKYGNVLLYNIVNEIKLCINQNSYVYKLGGNVLMLIIPDLKCRDNAVEIIKRVMSINDHLFMLAGKKIKIKLNLGASLYPYDDAELGNVFKYAAAALNYVNKKHDSSYEFFSSHMYKNTTMQEKIESDIQDALINHEFILYYQPQVNVNNMEVYGVEALIRWNHPEFGILPPSYFIDTVEQNGSIIEVGKIVFYRACLEIKRLHSLGYDNLIMSVNVSIKQLEDDFFLTFVKNILRATEVDPEYINFEITERMMINSTEKVADVLKNISDMGIKIFVDDFGTQYSFLNYLYSVPIDGIKIDRAFIDDIDKSDKKFIIVKNIIKLAHELNLDVVAEGVETPEQLDCLKKIDCNNIQGFLFERPLNSSQLINFLKYVKFKPSKPRQAGD